MTSHRRGGAAEWRTQPPRLREALDTDVRILLALLFVLLASTGALLRGANLLVRGAGLAALLVSLVVAASWVAHLRPGARHRPWPRDPRLRWLLRWAWPAFVGVVLAIALVDLIARLVS